MAKSQLLSCLAAALSVQRSLSALCSNWVDEATCTNSVDGACQCSWDGKSCKKSADKCSDTGFGITSVTESPSGLQKLGDSCGACFSVTGDCGTCESGLLCACVGSCANPHIADIPNICVATACPCGSLCRLPNYVGTGICGVDNETCMPSSGYQGQCTGDVQPCTLSDQITQVGIGWTGQDTGDNYCNSCSCGNGGLMCTEMACVPKDGSEDAKQKCTLSDGSTMVEDGWSGHDVGSNHCNSCTCSNGALGCTKMACQAAKKLVGQTCGECDGADCDECADNLYCVCVGDCADPDKANATKTCAVAPCPCGERCKRQSGSNMGMCLEDSKTCGQPLIAPQCAKVARAANCTLGRTGEQVPAGWSGNDMDNCNTCTCENGELMCTDLACGPSALSAALPKASTCLFAVAVLAAASVA